MAKKTRKAEQQKPVKKTSRKAKATPTVPKTSRKAKATQTVSNTFVISGRVTNRNPPGSVANLWVDAWHKGGPLPGSDQLIGPQPLLRKPTTAQGKFDITGSTGGPIPARPDLFFKVYNELNQAVNNKIVGSPADGILRGVESGRDDIVIEIDLPGERHVFNGKLVDDLTGNPLAGYTVLAKLTDTDPDTDLGSATTSGESGKEGQFTFIYTTTGATAPPPIEFHLDLTIRDPQGREISVPNVAVKDNELFEVRIPVPLPVTDVVPHRVYGRLLNVATGKPLARYKVFGADLDTGAEAKDIGYVFTTNGDEDETPSKSSAGYFTLVYTTTSVDPPTERHIRLRIVKDGQEIAQTDVTARSNELLLLSINAPPPPQPPSPSLEEVFPTLPPPPDGLLSFLQSKNIAALGDIRRKGGIRRLEGLPGGPDHPAVLALESHASLSAISSNVQLNADLINNGYKSAADVASAPRTNFVGDAYQRAGEFNAAQMQIAARAQSSFADSFVMAVMTDSVNGYDSTTGQIPIPDLPTERCQCKDCDSALSPRAYLADLLNYALDHVKNGSAKITLSFLFNNFRQPFGDLPASCAAVDKQVRQVRLCIEVLRRYLMSLPSPAPRTELEKAEEEYRFTAYATLLIKIGASYDEIRLARTAEPDERKALAERLGIDLGTGTPDHLTELFLAAPDEVTDQALEDLFGLLTPYPGSLTKNPQPKIQIWRLEHLRTLWRKQDFKTNPLTDGRPLIDPDLINTGDLEDPRIGDQAYDLWQARRDWLKSKMDELEAIRRGPAIDDRARINAMVRKTYEPLIVSADDLKALDDDQRMGKSIKARLGELDLSPDAFSYLVRIIKSIYSISLVLESEWEDVISILTQIQKRRKFAEWRAKEEAEGITLGPDYFRFPPVDFTAFPPPPPIELPVWRATSEARDEWQGVLQSRIDQEDAVIDELNEIISSTEEVTLPALRDALIREVPQGSSLSGKAKWVTDNLLIDAEDSGCLKTTHIAQAIETIQSLLFSLYTKQLSDAYPNLTLDADAFEEEWKWLNSYATWRAAMSVFLYPENIMLPSLRHHQTPAFRALVKSLRDNTRLTPEGACVAAKDYSDYFRDVSSLRVEATCHAFTQTHRGDCRRKTPTGYRLLFYMFARSGLGTPTSPNPNQMDSNVTNGGQPHSGLTDRVYWVAYDPHDREYAQTLWDVVPGLKNVSDILGAVAFEEGQDRRFIYLFATTQELEKQKLVLSKFDLVNQTWSEIPQEIQLPLDKDEPATSFTAVVRQTMNEVSPPEIAVLLSNGEIHTRILHGNNDWKLLVGSYCGKGFSELNAMIEIAPDEFYLIARRITGRLFYRLFGPDNDDGVWRILGQDLPRTEFRGAFTWPIGNHAYVFYTEANNYYQVIKRSPINRVTDRTEINSISAFDDWLREVACVSLGNLLVTDTDRDIRLSSGMSFLRFFTLIDPVITKKEEYKERVRGYFDFIEKELIEEESERGRNWKLADKMVREMDIAEPGLSLRQALLHIFDGTTPPQKTIRFRKRDPANKELSLPLLDSSTREGIAVSAGSDTFEATVSGKLLAYQLADIDIGSYRSRFRRSGDELDEGTPARVGPIVRDPSDIAESGFESNEPRRFLIEKVFADNVKEPRSSLIYLEEAYYFVPVQLALQLQSRGHYTSALNWFRTVYDYSLPVNKRKIYFGLIQEESPKVYDRAGDWLRDPLNPHAVAEKRTNTYTRYTLLALARCLLDFADSEYTRDTSESIARARILYLTALELLDLSVLKQKPGKCEDILKEFRIDIDDPQWGPVATGLINDIGKINDPNVVAAVTNDIRLIMANKQSPLPDRFTEARGKVNAALENQSAPVAYSAVLATHAQTRARAHLSLQAEPQVFRNVNLVGSFVGQDFLSSAALVTGKSEADLPTESLPWLRAPKGTPINGSGGLLTAGTSFIQPDAAFMDGGAGAAPGAGVVVSFDPGEFSLPGRQAQAWAVNPVAALQIVTGFVPGFIPGPSFFFCIPPNQILKTMRQRAELNLYKLRSCRDISGTVRQLEPFAISEDVTSGLSEIETGRPLDLPGALTLQPTQYRYAVLIERARQLVNHAQQLEASLLQTLEKRDAEFYNLLLARRDVSLTQAGVRLQALKVREAEDGVRLAELQHARAKAQKDHYTQLIEEGVNDYERDALIRMRESADFHKSAANFATAAGVLGGLGALAGGIATGGAAAIAVGALGGLGSLVGGFGSSDSSKAALASTRASIAATLASYERRAQDWALQQKLSHQDIRIGAQNEIIAEDQVRVTGQERNISEIQAEHAEVTADFLANKFTGVELYDWMSSVLEQVYRFFLQQATALAQLATNQLAFERQEAPPPFIQADYWEAPTDLRPAASANGQSSDRRGLTGSARLLQDIFQLDQFAFEKNRRKLELSKTFSLSQLAPVELERFRNTGVMTFATPIELFDREYPGHYLRLIKRVRTSVIALIPPAQGIRATLSNNGVSRVIIGRRFQSVTLRRDPESVALSSPREATGLFELSSQADFLAPFEAMGVECNWELRMPKSANPFDFRTIADVLVTIEYTALDSASYRTRVIRNLPATFSAERPFSFRNEFSDQWYDLHNPDLTSNPMTVRFNVHREDFPPNIEELNVDHITLFFSAIEEKSFEETINLFRFIEGPSGNEKVGGDATTDASGIISTRRGQIISWKRLRNIAPFGEWELALPVEVRDRFTNEEIEDILFVITYSGRTPEWPV